MADFVGTSGDDTFNGGGTDDTAQGKDGNDHLYGDGGNDVLAGDTGADYLDGGSGDDTLYSASISPAWKHAYGFIGAVAPVLDTGSEVDTLLGGAGFDTMFAGYGDNVDGGADGATLLIGFQGASAGVTVDFNGLNNGGSLVIGGGTITNISSVQWVDGSNFNDTITASSSGSTSPDLRGLGGDDRLVAGYYESSISGGDGNDVLDGRSSRYGGHFFGEAGDDTLYASAGRDYLDGGAGYDTAIIDYTNAGSPGESYYHSIQSSNGAISGRFYGNNIYYGTEISDFENVDFRASAASDIVYVDVAGDPGTWRLSLDGGAGFDSITLRLDGSSDVLIGSVVNGVLDSGRFILSNFEQFDLKLDYGNDRVALGAGNDRVSAGRGDDTIEGGGGNDFIEAQGGSDHIFGGDGNDVLYADDESPTVDTGSAIDELSGGNGNDYISIGYGDTADGGSGIDTLSIGLAGAGSGVNLDLSAVFAGGSIIVGGGTISGFENYSVIYGTDFADTIVTGNLAVVDGSPSSVIYGFAGDDIISTGGQRDTVFGGDGRDTIHSGSANDQVYGDAGNDNLFGEAGDDRINGGENDDIVHGGDGNDTLQAGGGSDQLFGDAGDDSLSTRTDYGTPGGTGSLLDGGDGDDWLYAGSGDTVIGGAGTDTLSLDLSNTSVGTLIDLRDAFAGSTSMVGGRAVTAVEQYTTLTGTAYDDVILIGNAIAASDPAKPGILLGIFGGAGNDMLVGGNGADLLDGGTGDDRLVGGAGNDSYFVDSASDLVFESSGGGIDIVRYIGVSGYYLHANIENATLESSGGSGKFLVGNELANNLAGNSADDLLLGGAGDDTIQAGYGNDSVFGESGADYVLGGGGIDYIAGGAGNDVLDGETDADAIYGEAGDDTLIGGIGFSTDILVGGDGNDVIHGDSRIGDYDLMYGNAGDDTFYVDTPSDLVFEQPDEGDDTVYASIDRAGYYLYANIENLVLLDSTPFGVGNALNNRLTGNGIGNYLLGGAGDDVLNGKGGNDVLFGEAGADRFVFEHGTGGDVIGDFTPGTDKIDLTAIGYSWQQVQNALHENGGNTAIDLGGGDLVVLNGVVAAQLSASDFILAGTAPASTAVQATLGFQPADVLRESQTMSDSVVDARPIGSRVATINTAFAGSTTTLLQQVAFINGLNPDGSINSDSYFGSEGRTAYKFGSPTAGTGATITYAFDPASVFTATEQQAFNMALATWSSVANITFVAAASSAAANLLMHRGSDGGAQTSVSATIGHGTTIGTIAGQVTISIDTSTYGFDMSGSFDSAGGYGLATLIHEIGHALGLGHSGLYDGNVTPSTDQYSPYDERMWTNMSYIAWDDGDAKYRSAYPVTGTDWGSYREADGAIGKRDAPHTVMQADILAIQQLYGAPTSTPLAGGQVYGFNSNVTGALHNFFDFTINSSPVVTLFNIGTNNTLDLSGYSVAQTVSLLAGSFSSVGGLTNNLSIAAGTAINTAIGGSGNDTIRANDNGDTLRGNAGNDTLIGGAGNDVINGGANSDTMSGGGGDDRFVFSFAQQSTQQDSSTIDGGTGSDTVDVTNLAITSLAMSGGVLTMILGSQQFAITNVEHILLGNEANAVTLADNRGPTLTIHSGGGTDILTGSGNYFFYGEQGDDGFFITGLAGNATNGLVDGGAGTDTLNTGTGFTVDLANGVAQALGSTYQLAGIENVNVGAANGLAATVIGDGNANVFGVTASANDGSAGVTFQGRGGDDVLIGGAGNDLLDGGTGVDRLYGGLGNDVFYVDRQDDVVFENANAGTDSVISTGNFYLYANIENLTLAAGAGNIFGVGNELDNSITGNESDNTLLAGAGADAVHAGAGIDIVYGQDGDDQLFGDAGNDFLAGGNGNDTIDGGAGGDSVYGEAGNDILYGGTTFEFDILVGGDGNDVLHGDSGNGDYDYLYGNAGDDSFYVDTGDDLTFEQPNEGTDTVYANVAGANNGVYLYANIENLVLLGTTTFGVGNELANVMTGNASANYLLGGGGNDILNGKAGNDVLFGQAGADTFVFEHGTGGDVIGDFAAGTDKIDLSAIGFTNYQAVVNSMHEVNGTTAIDLGGGDLIVLNGVTIAQLHAGDFILGNNASAPAIAAAAPTDQAVRGFQVALDALADPQQPSAPTVSAHPPLAHVWAIDVANDNGVLHVPWQEIIAGPLDGAAIV